MKSMSNVISFEEKKKDMKYKLNNLIDEQEKELEELNNMDDEPQNFFEAQNMVKTMFSLSRRMKEIHELTEKLYGHSDVEIPNILN